MVRFVVMSSFVLLSIAPLACASQGRYTSMPQQLEVALGPPPGANVVKWGALGGVYRVAEEYPAKEFIAGVDGRLRKAGWSPLREDVFNPGLPTSHESGWSDFVDGRTKPERRLFQWMGQWANTSGDVVVIGLTFRSESSEFGAKPSGPLEVGVSLLSKESLAKQGATPASGR